MQLIEFVYGIGQQLWIWVHSPVGTSIITTLFLISERLGMSEKYKNSAVLGVIKDGLGKLKEKIPSPKP